MAIQFCVSKVLLALVQRSQDAIDFVVIEVGERFGDGSPRFARDDGVGGWASDDGAGDL